MQDKSFIKHYGKKILIIIGAFLLVLAGITLYLGQRWSGKLRTQLKDYVAEMSDSLYIMRYDGVTLNMFKGQLTLNNVSLVSDSVVYRRLQQQQRAPSVLYSFSADHMSLSYFKVWRYFMKKELSAGSLVLDNPSIVLEQDSRNVDTTRRRNAYENISSRIRSLSIGSLRLDSSNFKYVYIKKDNAKVITQLHHLSIHVNDLLIDAKAMEDPTRFLYARNYELHLRDYRHRTADSLYWMIVRDVSYNAAESNLTIGQFSVEPRYSRSEFDKRIKFQQDRFDVQFNNIAVNKLEPNVLLQKQQVRARRVDIGSGNIQIYHNRLLPSSNQIKTGQFPHQLLQKLSVPVLIDSLRTDRLDLSYMELNEKSLQAGTILFRQVHGLFRNITNIDTVIARNPHCIADLDAVFMQKGKLRARFDFILNGKAGDFAISGQLKDMDGRELTPLTRPLALIEIKSGYVQEVSFHMRGNEKSAAGEVKLLYNNLKVRILKRDEETREIKRKGLLSLFANAIAINDSNPRDGKLHIAHPRYTRDPRKSFFNLVWKTLFTGVKEIAVSGNMPL
jgi:hypothetical protein